MMDFIWMFVTIVVGLILIDGLHKSVRHAIREELQAEEHRRAHERREFWRTHTPRSGPAEPDGTAYADTKPDPARASRIFGEP